MESSWAEDIDDSSSPAEFDEDLFEGTSIEEDKSSSCKSDRLSNVERHSRDSSTDLSVTTRSDVSKSFSRLSNNENAPSAESEHHLLDLLSVSGFPMTQVNGQRKLGPPPGWNKPPPDPSCEIFVGKIPRNLYEHEIYPIFKKMGDVYEIRLMMDFSGTNRGYCFVMFTKAEYAKRAIKELNNYAIRPGRKIGVVASINNCRLWIGQLPSEIDPEIVIKKFYEITDEVSKVAVYKYPNGLVRCALVSYKTHRGAAMARRRLLPERGNLFAKVEVSVDWAPPNMSFNNVVEINGERDEEGKLVISESSVIANSKRRGSQRRNGCDDFLDQSIKNYLQENCSTLSASQRKSLESSLRSQKAAGRGCTFPPRRKGYRANQSKSFDLESRGRGCSKESPSSDRSRSLPVSPRENFTVGRDGLWYPKNRDINGNITTSKYSQEFSNGSVIEICNKDTFDTRKVSNSSVSGINKEKTIVRGPIKILTKRGGSLDPPPSFNLFEHYALLSAKKSESTSGGKSSSDALSGASFWGGSVPNVFRSLETRSDCNLQKPQDNQLKFADEKCANFAEFGKWNSTESFVPRVDIGEKVKDDSSKGFRNQRRNFRACAESGIITSQQKIMPNFRVLSPLTNWNGNYSLNHNQIPGDYCADCIEQTGTIHREVYFPEEIFAPYLQQHDWRILNGTLENREFFESGQLPRVANFLPQSFFSTSSFADYHRFLPQIYSGNVQSSLHPRPILNRLTATVGHSI